MKNNKDALRLPKVEFSRLPPLFCLSFGAFISLAITAFVLETRSTQKQLELASNYGSALVRLVAMESSESVVSEDLLGLHALLSDVVALPMVSFASVSDPDKVLLAQAGEENSLVFSESFTAAVQLHDKVGAYVSITMAVGFESDTTLRWVLAAIGALLLIMSGLALYETPVSALTMQKKQYLDDDNDEDGASFSLPVKTPTSLGRIDKADTSVANEEEVRPDDHRGSQATSMDEDPLGEPSSGNSMVDLIIALPNYTRLERQLSDIAFSRRVAYFEKQFRNVLPLYNGLEIQTPAAQGVYCLRFHSENNDESVFNAVSAACLIRSLDQTQKIKFHFLAAICSEDFDVQLSDSDRGIYLHQGLLSLSLEEKLDFGEIQKSYYPVDGLKGDYAEFLRQQAEQLS